MSKVRNIQTGEIQDVTDDQLGSLLISGDYEPEAGSRVAVVNEFGEIGSVDASEFMSGAAEQSGMRVATPQEIAEQRKQQEYGEGLATVQAAGEGALRGASVGLSDLLLTNLGVSSEGLRERKERNPIASGGGEAVGILGSVLLSGGVGGAEQAVGRGALATAGRVGLGAVRASPAALIARGGVAAERGLAQIIGRGAAQKALATAAVGAAEGALYGAGESISEATLGDHELTAERVLASAGHGAIWGGATGGLMSLVGSGVSAVARKVRPRTAIEAALERSPMAAEESVVTDLAKARSIADDIPATNAQKGFLKRTLKSADDFVQGRRALRGLESTQDEIAEDITRGVSRLEEIRDAALNDLTIAKKTAAIGKAMREEAPASPQIVADFVEDSMMRTKEKYMRIIENADGLYEGYETGLVKRKLHNFDQQLFRVKKLARSDNVVEAGEELFGILDQTKRDLGDIADSLEGTKYENRVMGKSLRDHYMQLRDELTDDNVWGSRASDIQRADNAAWSTDIDTKSAYNRYFLSDAGGKKKTSGFGLVRVGNVEKVKSAVRNADSELDLNNTIMRRSVKAQAELLEQLGSSHASVEVGTHSLVNEAKELSNKILTRMDEAASISRQAKNFKGIIESSSDVPIWGQLVKTLAWAADNGYRADSTFLNGKIQNTLRSLAGETATKAGALKAINKRSDSVAEVTKRAVNGFFKLGKRVPIPLAITQYDKGENLNTRYNKIIERHDAILSNQGLIADRSSQLLDPLIAPNTSVALTNTAIKAAAFLKSKQPTPNVRPSDVFAHLDKRQRVADSEISKYLRYAEGVEHPVQAIERFGKSGDMARETAEAIRTVFPKLFQEFETKITEKLIDAKEPLPYGDLMRLSFILDRPLHPSLEGRYIALCQDSYKQMPNETVSPSRQSMPDTSKNYLSPSQRLAS